MQREGHGGQSATQTIAQAKMIIFALIAGVVIFTAVAAVLGPGMAGGGEADAPESAFPASFLYVAIAVGVITAAAAIFVRRFLASRVGRRRDEALLEIKDGMIPPELLTATMTGAALAEGGGMLGAVGMLLTGNYVYLAMPALAVAVMLTFIPTQSSLENLAHE